MWSFPQSPDGSTAAMPAVSLSEETTELIARLTEMQQEKWSLEEKVCPYFVLFLYLFSIFIVFTSNNCLTA